MNKCPKCNNTLSSSDVLCPRCGAMVEEINTKVSIKKFFADKPVSNNSESTTLPDDYENIIMYNESFPMMEPEPPEAPQEPNLIEEPEDFDIEKYISSNGTSDHINPLLAHVKKQQSHAEDKPIAKAEPQEEELQPEQETDALDLCDMAPEELKYEPDSIDNSQTNKVVLPNEVVLPKETALPGDNSQPVALNDLGKIVTELTQSQEKKDDGFPIDGTPSYSKVYLEALRNIDITDDEIEESDFDPDAFMEQYRQSKKLKQEPINNSIEPEPPKEEEPLRRRYNPNKPKPKYDEEELLEEIKKQKDIEQQETDSESEKFKEEEKALDLELDPGRFFVADETNEQDIPEEHFVVDEDKEVKSAQSGYVPTEDYTHEEVKSQETILDRVDSAAKYTPAVKTRKRLPVWAAVFIWLAVAGGVFFGAYTFDNYVNKTYSGYNEYINEITDGKISIEAILN